MNINTQDLQATIKHEVDVAVTLATCSVIEVTPKKYSEMTGISYSKIMDWCKNQTLSARRVNSGGVEVENGGSWLVTVNSRILAKKG